MKTIVLVIAAALLLVACGSEPKECKLLRETEQSNAQLRAEAGGNPQVLAMLDQADKLAKLARTANDCF